MGVKAKKSRLARFLVWRYKHVSHRKFVFFLSLLVGFSAGMGAVILKNLTHFIQYLLEGKFIQYYHHAFYFIFPLIGVSLTLLVIKYVIKDRVGHGIPSVLYAISKRKSIMPKKQMFASLITAPLTVGFGGSVGLEGPTVATGTALGSFFSKLFHMNQATRTLMIACAAAGAMSAIFKAPITAIIFAVEVFSLDLTLVSLIPLLLASSSAIITSHLFFGSEIILHFQLKDSFTIQEVPFYILLGVIAAFTSIYFTKMYSKIGDFFDKIKTPFKRLIIGGLGIGLLVFMIPPLFGEGFGTINNLLEENYLQALGNNFFDDYLDQIWVVIALLAGMVIFKVIATACTFGAGGVGGIFAPSLFIGSAMGHCFALILNNLPFASFKVSESNFTLVGMAGVMAGVLHAPLTAIFLIAELTGGYELFIPLMITATISFSLTKYFISHSVYTMQLAKKGQLMTHNKDKNVLMMLKLDKLIERDFISVQLEMTLGDLVKNAVVKSNRNIFPVVNEDNTFLGIVLLDNIRTIMFDTTLYEKVSVKELLINAPGVILYKVDSMETIMGKFQSSAAWNLPVIKDGKYIGFISKSKLLTAYRRKLIDDTLK